MKTLNLFFDFELTSLSPDAQPISLGIVSDEIENISNSIDRINYDMLFGENAKNTHYKSFYAEFSDFDVNRCDNWVCENVIKKLKIRDGSLKMIQNENGDYEGRMEFNDIKVELKEWLKQFSDYQIQFIGDCCTWDWWFMVQLLAEWKKLPLEWTQYLHKIRHKREIQDVIKKYNLSEQEIKNYQLSKLIVPKNQNPLDFIKEINKNYSHYNLKDEYQVTKEIRIGLPKLPDNISPVPFDLNDLIAIKEDITPKKAFDIDRDNIMFPKCLIVDETQLSEEKIKEITELYQKTGNYVIGEEIEGIEKEKSPKHYALYDAYSIMKIYNKLK